MFIELAQQRSQDYDLVNSHVFLVPQNLEFIYDQLNTDVLLAVIFPERTFCEQGSKNH